MLTLHKSCNLIPPLRELSRIGIWCDRGPYDYHTAPMTNPHHLGGAELILGQVRLPQGYQQPPGRTTFLKPSKICPILYIHQFIFQEKEGCWQKFCRRFVNVVESKWIPSCLYNLPVVQTFVNLSLWIR